MRWEAETLEETKEQTKGRNNEDLTIEMNEDP